MSTHTFKALVAKQLWVRLMVYRMSWSKQARATPQSVHTHTQQEYMNKWLSLLATKRKLICFFLLLADKSLFTQLKVAFIKLSIVVVVVLLASVLPAAAAAAATITVVAHLFLLLLHCKSNKWTANNNNSQRIRFPSSTTSTTALNGPIHWRAVDRERRKTKDEREKELCVYHKLSLLCKSTLLQKASS